MKPFPLKLLLPLGLCALTILLVLHIGLGKVQLTPLEVFDALRNQPAEAFHRQIVWDLRLPRGLIAVLAGAMLGLAGAILQSLTRNPLADPWLTGVSSGAVLFAVAWNGLGGSAASLGQTLTPIALTGGMCAGLLVYLMGRNPQGRSDPWRLTLTGILVSSILGSITSMLLLLNTQTMGGILGWMIGSLNGRVWVHWAALWPWALAALPLGLGCASLANLLHLGDDVAAGLGLRVEAARGILLFAAALLTSAAVSVVGSLGFIGLVGPHIARRLVGGDARRLFPVSALLGAGLLLVADIIAQSAAFDLSFFRITDRVGLPVGAVTTFLGAGFLLYLLQRGARRPE